MKNEKLRTEKFYEECWQWWKGRPAYQASNKKLNFLKKYASKKNKVLDLGCGDGKHYGLFLSKLVKNYIGVDISKLAVKEAKKQGLNAIAHDLQKPLPFVTNSFDLAVCMDTLEHLFDPELTMKEIYRVVKPQGIVVISMPNVGWIYQRILMLFGIFYPFGAPHLGLQAGVIHT